ncbi:MAG TPA: L-histidine N(alpha)-methyltransferase [Steroidobacteraceae bacterium]|nr:L-histidine N(alpha)-methyltransferase [Steroidobacteraceae bacterium]
MTPPVGAVAAARESAADFTAEFAEEARRGLSQKPRRLPSRYLYDALGSALFDAICELPWYRVTRAEMRLLRSHAPEVWQAMSPLDRLIELGAGDGRKLAALLSGRPRMFAPLRIDLVDVSASALDAAARAAGATAGTRVVKHLAAYEEGLLEAASGPAPRDRALVLFLGSNIGNFDPPAADALLRAIARRLRPGDALLLGADLEKPERELLLAYDDPLGVTAAFNLNLLVRMNRELGAGFDPAKFSHRATWNARESRVEMHLVSRARQRVRIPAARLDLDLRAGESIWTESSYKYRPVDVLRMTERAGFAVTRHWQDVEACFSLTLCELHAPAG